jgi:uncharacterized membrane protein (DUF2068 family)
VARLNGFVRERLSRVRRARGDVHPAALFALGYGLLELVEGTRLWLDQLWAEYLTVIATSILIPFEIYELVRHPSVWKGGGIAVNIAIVIYLAQLLRRRMAAASTGT